MIDKSMWEEGLRADWRYFAVAAVLWDEGLRAAWRCFAVAAVVAMGVTLALAFWVRHELPPPDPTPARAAPMAPGDWAPLISDGPAVPAPIN
jgi:hypothetical protein